jgi:hypothetical protein
MQLSDDAIREYILIYREDFGEELTMAEARAMASRLVALYEVLYRPLPGEHLKPQLADPVDPGKVSSSA